MNLNKAIIVGRVTADMQLKTTQGGHSVVSFSLATNRSWTNDKGQKQEETEFHNIVAWGRTAEVVAQFCVKGSELLVEGRLQTRKWEHKNGQTRYTTEIVAERVQLGAKPNGAKSAAAPATSPASAEQQHPQEEIPTIHVEDMGGVEDPFAKL